MTWLRRSAILVAVSVLLLSLKLGTSPDLLPNVLSVLILRGDTDQAVPLGTSPTAQWNILEHLGGNSPWIVKFRGTVENSVDPPEGCYVDQVHMLARHAERYPTFVVGIAMLELYHRIKDSNITLKGDLAFANSWNFFATEPQTQFEQLVSTGQYAGSLEAFGNGVTFRTRYKHLLDFALERGLVSFWASGSKRVIETAKYFATGFFGIDWKNSATLHVIPETPERGANTLTPGRSCVRYRENKDNHGHAYGYRMLEAFRRTYEPSIVERLIEQNPHFPFTEKEVFTMQQICGFETIAMGFSPWCGVFTHEEWDQFEYARDVIHYYRTGPGNPYSGTMGWLWLNATADLLEKGPVSGPLFLSFVHDGDIIPILNALDIFPQSPDLPVTHMLVNRTWRTSDVVPMGGRIIFERLVCKEPQHCWSNEPFYPNHVYCDPQTYNISVRVNINDGIIGIPGCDHGHGKSCPLHDFTARIQERGREFTGFREMCGLKDDVPDTLSFLHQ